ncbi:MAG: hypothetical protein Q7T55_16245 [Solirubrobacteraceae bacterium]|nr:hypothetical protein [Solirubrobacteraceae bacterium]
MAERPGSALWLLTPEQLIVICDLLGIAELPHSRYVDGSDEEIPAVVQMVGLRSAAIVRLIDVDGSEDGPRVEALLAETLLALIDSAQEAVGHVALRGDQASFVVGDGLMLSLREEDELVELRLEPVSEGIERLRSRCAATLDAGLTVDDLESEALVAESRWNRLVAGGPERSSDDPIVTRAARAVAAQRFAEVTVIRADPGTGYTGSVLGWFDGGAITIEPEVEDASEDEPLFRLRTGVDVRAELDELWAVLTPVVAG